MFNRSTCITLFKFYWSIIHNVLYCYVATKFDDILLSANYTVRMVFYNHKTDMLSCCMHDRCTVSAFLGIGRGNSFPFLIPYILCCLFLFNLSLFYFGHFIASKVRCTQHQLWYWIYSYLRVYAWLSQCVCVCVWELEKSDGYDMHNYTAHGSDTVLRRTACS